MKLSITLRGLVVVLLAVAIAPWTQTRAQGGHITPPSSSVGPPVTGTGPTARPPGGGGTTPGP